MICIHCRNIITSRDLGAADSSNSTCNPCRNDIAVIENCEEVMSAIGHSKMRSMKKNMKSELAGSWVKFGAKGLVAGALGLGVAVATGGLGAIGAAAAIAAMRGMQEGDKSKYLKSDILSKSDAEQYDIYFESEKKAIAAKKSINDRQDF